MPELILERKIYKKIKPYLDTRDIIVIHGARQTGEKGRAEARKRRKNFRESV